MTTSPWRSVITLLTCFFYILKLFNTFNQLWDKPQIWRGFYCLSIQTVDVLKMIRMKDHFRSRWFNSCMWCTLFLKVLYHKVIMITIHLFGFSGIWYHKIPFHQTLVDTDKRADVTWLCSGACQQNNFLAGLVGSGRTGLMSRCRKPTEWIASMDSRICFPSRRVVLMVKVPLGWLLRRSARLRPCSSNNNFQDGALYTDFTF